MSQTFSCHLYNRLEKIGDKNFNHIGCEGETEQFIKFLGQFVPELGMRRKVKFTIELKEDPKINEDYKVPKEYYSEYN